MKLSKNIIFLLAGILFIFLLSGCTPEQKIDIPLSEHPRPDFKRDAWLNLNGQWDFAFDSFEVGETDKWYTNGNNFDRKITVPFSWAAPFSGVGIEDIHVAWYSRLLEIPDNEIWDHKRIFMVIGACDFSTKLWLNEELVGEHEGGYVPFQFDLTDFINESGENCLVMRVEDKPEYGRQTGKQGYGPAKGIWQTVYLEARPETHITLAHFSPDIEHGSVKLRVELSGLSDNNLNLSVLFKDKSVSTTREVFPPGQKELEFTIPIPHQRLWTLDSPYLYDVDLILSTREEELDRIHTYFGMRKISTARLPGTKDMYVTLNDKPVYLQMALDQAYHPKGYYTFPDDKFIKEEILRAKNIGLNGLRIHIKVAIPRKLYWADKLGLFIQCDMPSLDTPDDPGIPSASGKKNYEYTLINHIRRDYNHPSIFSWVLFNETWGLESNDRDVQGYPLENREWVESLYYRAKEMDPTRLIEDNSPDKQDHIVSDINCWHKYLPALQYEAFLDNAVANSYPGSAWNYIGGNKQTDIPLLNTECGAEHGYKGGAGDIDLSYEYHIMVNTFRKYRKNTGFVFTQFHDVIDEWNGYYRYDRTIKEWGLDELCPGMRINDFHSELYLIPGGDFNRIVKPGSVFEVPLIASVLTDKASQEMTIKTLVHGWDRYGTHKEFAAEEFTFKPQPYKVYKLDPLSITAPGEECLAVFCTFLIDQAGDTINRNFVPFRVIAKSGDQGERAANKKDEIRHAAADFSKSAWSVKQYSVMNGLKVWGMGTGFFEYTFPVPEDFKADRVKDVEFLAELSARNIQGKYMRDDLTYRGKHFEEIGTDAFDPGYGTNSFPMTDKKKHASTVYITLNGLEEQSVFLEDDPADHRGLLSWMSQKRPVDQEWELEEAGSYGYLVRLKFNGAALEKAVKEKIFRIKLFVPESSEDSGGLAVYGADFGRYPFGPTMIINFK